LEIILIEKFLMGIGKPIKVIPKHKKNVTRKNFLNLGRKNKPKKTAIAIVA
jgi:hypothetical protein